MSAPDVAKVVEALGDLARYATVREPERFAPDAVLLTVPDPGYSLSGWQGIARQVAQRLRDAGYRVEGHNPHYLVRLPLEAGRLAVRQVVERGHRGRRYRAAGQWDLLDADGKRVGRVWRSQNKRERVEYETRPGICGPVEDGVKSRTVEQEARYRVALDGFPENPREYPTRGAAVAAAEQALARRAAR